MAGPLPNGIGRPDINHTEIPGAHTRPGIFDPLRDQYVAIIGQKMGEKNIVYAMKKCYNNLVCGQTGICCEACRQNKAEKRE